MKRRYENEWTTAHFHFRVANPIFAEKESTTLLQASSKGNLVHQAPKWTNRHIPQGQTNMFSQKRTSKLTPADRGWRGEGTLAPCRGRRSAAPPQHASSSAPGNVLLNAIMSKGTAPPPTELGTHFQSSPQSHTFVSSCYFCFVFIFDQLVLKLDIKMRQDS
jgi:hypothetical protein